MAGNGRSVQELNAEASLTRARQKREFWEGFWRSVAVVLPAAFKWLFFGWLATKSADVLISWRGLSTQADVNVNVIADVLGKSAPAIGLPWILVLVLAILYTRERKLKEREIAKLGDVTAAYERLSDPGRTSSQLLPSGKPQPRDLP